MALPYCECGLSIAKSIPGMLGRMASGPRCISWMHTAHWSQCLSSGMSCSFAADSPSTLKDIIVRAGPEKATIRQQSAPPSADLSMADKFADNNIA